jgi:hypothetical protein
MKMLNDTLEEELRLMLCNQQEVINVLQQNILALKKMVAEETEAKYLAYSRNAELQEELTTQSKNSS